MLGIILITTSLYAVDIQTELRGKYQQKLDYKRDVYNKTLNFIKDNPDSPSLARLYFNLAEMSVEIDVNDPKTTANYYEMVIEKDPEFDKMDVALYNYAFYYKEAQLNKRNTSRQINIEMAINWPDSLRINEQNLKPSLDAYQVILSDFPNSEYSSDVLYRLGNLYFEVALDARRPLEYYDHALEYFDRLSQVDGDPLQNYGVFQKGWTYFASARFEESIEQFSSILQIIQADSTSDYKAFFEADAIDNIAFSLIEYDGSDFEQYSVAAQKAIEIFQSFDPEYVKEIILAAVDLKQKYNAPMQAVDLYNSYVQLYPNNIEAPIIVDSVMAIYRRNPSRTRENKAEDEIIAQLERITTEFGSNSEWYNTNKTDLSPDSDQMGIIRNAFEFNEPRYLNSFVRSKRYDDYSTYRDLTTNFAGYEEISDSSGVAKIKEMRLNVVQMSQEMAEQNKAPFDYLVAINNIAEFDTLYHNYIERPELKAFEYNDYEQLFTILRDTVNVAPYYIAELDQTIDKAQLDSLFVTASKYYQDYLANSDTGQTETLARVVYQRAETNYDNENIDKAYLEFDYLIKVMERDSLYSDTNLEKISYARLAEISQSRGEYQQAETYYRQANKYANEEEKANYQNNILASMQAKANTLADSSNYLIAADEFLRISQELLTTDPAKSIGFKTKAIENYKLANENQKAIDLLLEIAAEKDGKIDKLAAFISAWTITDSLTDYSQSELLRNMFIDQYPNSNEAYRLRVQVIDFYENEPHQDSLRAAQMYMGLHEDATAGDLDIGEISPASIYLKSYALSQSLEQAELVDMMLDFEKRYPDHEMANQFLTQVAAIYSENEETEKFESIARKIYRKDPTINILQDVAVSKLKKLKAEIDALFDEKRFDEMFVAIENFKVEANSYSDEGLTLPLQGIYDSFDYFKEYVDFYQLFEEKLAKVREDFINATPNELVRVNENTTWKGHLYAGKNRIKKLMQNAQKNSKELIEVIKAGNEYDLPTEKRTEALYMAGQVFEYSSEVIMIQLTKFLDESNQLNNEQVAQNPVLQKKYKDQLGIERNKVAQSFKIEAAKIYISLMKTFVDDKEYSDEFSDLAKGSLVEWGVRKPKIYMNFYTNTGWQINSNTPVDSLAYVEWDSVQLASNEALLDSADVLVIPPSDQNLVKSEINLEYVPELLIIEYVADFVSELYINQQKVEKDHNPKELIDFGERKLQEYTLVASGMLTVGSNEIMFVVPGNPETEVNFAAHIKVQYDKERLDFIKSTEQKKLFTGYDWKVIPKGQISVDSLYAQLTNTVIDSTDTTTEEIVWENAGPANFQFYKNQIYGMENSEATEIWYPVIDTTKTDTMIFFKELEMAQEVISASAKYLGQQMCSIWVNGQLIVQDSETVFDTKLMQTQAHEVELANLHQGRNIILIEVTGSEIFKGLILEMDYTVRK